MQDEFSTEETILAQFDKKFLQQGSECTWKDINGLFPDEIKDFLLDAMKTVRADERTRIVGEVEEMTELPRTDLVVDDERTVGYTKALNGVIALLRK